MEPVNIFVSYAREDQPAAEKLVNELQAQGLTVWFDRRNIKPSQYWDEEIERGILNASHLILLASPRAVDSHYVREELHYAKDTGKTNYSFDHRRMHDASRI